MRLFIGLNLSQSIKARISKLNNTLDNAINKGDKVPTDNLHITLRYIGETSIDQQIRIIESLKTYLEPFKEFPVKLSKFGCFTKQNKHTVWLGVLENTNLNHLYNVVNTALKAVDIVDENRPFTPHITLRKKARLTSSVTPLQTGVIDVCVKEVTLFQSHRVFNALTYTPIANIVLSKSDAGV